MYAHICRPLGEYRSAYGDTLYLQDEHKYRISVGLHEIVIFTCYCYLTIFINKMAAITKSDANEQEIAR